MQINWYPGHMKKTKDSIKKNLPLVDIVYEVIDARVPYSSQNPDIDTILQNKPRLIIMNKSDLASEKSNKIWQDYFKENYEQTRVIFVDSIKRKGIDNIIDSSYELTKEKRKSMMARGVIKKPIRAMIVGVPNVGKSTLINSLSKRKGAKIGNKPGITRANQWIKIKGDLELLDTPGMLWPKFEDKDVGLNLGFTGAIKDELLDIEVLTMRLVEKLNLISPNLLEKRYNVYVKDKSSIDIIIDIGKKRGCIVKGGEVDFNKACEIILDEFRKGVIGRVTLELPIK